MKFIEKIHLVPNTLLVQGLKNHMTGSVGGVTGPLNRFLGFIIGMAPETALGDLAFRRPVEGQPHMFQFDNGINRFPTQDIDCILVGQIVTPFHCIIRVPFTVILFHIAQSRSNAPLGSARMGAGWIEFGNDGYIYIFAGIEGGH
jgi:hypothetical protein